MHLLHLFFFERWSFGVKWFFFFFFFLGSAENSPMHHNRYSYEFYHTIGARSIGNGKNGKNGKRKLGLRKEREREREREKKKGRRLRKEKRHEGK